MVEEREKRLDLVHHLVGFICMHVYFYLCEKYKVYIAPYIIVIMSFMYYVCVLEKDKIYMLCHAPSHYMIR